MNMRKSATFFLAVAAVCIVSQTAWAFDYTGKRLTLVVNHAVGGSTDIEARLLARHLSRVVPGSPTFIVQNIAGAGGSVAVNWLAEVARPDGLVMGYFAGMASHAALQGKNLRVDLKKFALLAASPGINVTFARRDLLSRMDKPDDFLKASDFWIGGLSAESNKDVRLRMQMDLLGMNYHYLTGYKGSSEARLALRRKEIQVYVEALSAYRSSIEEMVKAGEVLPIWYDPLFKDGKAYRSSDTKDIPAEPFDEFIRRVKGVEPTGEMWEAYKLVTQFSTTFLYLMMMPPGAPPEAVEIMKAAISKLNDDPVYQQEAARLLGKSSDYAVGPGVQAEFLKTITPEPSIREFVERYIAKGFQTAGGR
jgi:tripartite-type tricarboxylate transporter receptor subunit TctC